MRRRTALALSLGLALAATVAARPAGAQTLATEDPVLRQIWDHAMNRSQMERMMQVLLDSIGPRLTGSPEAVRAQEWVVSQLKGWGIQAERKQYGTWEGWDRGTSHIDLVAPRVRSLEGRMLAWSPGTGGKPVEGGVVPLPTMKGIADFEAFLPQVKGKFVMIAFPQPTCRTNAQWEQFGAPGSFDRMSKARQTAEQAWNASIQSTGLTNREIAKRLEAAGAAGIATSVWAGGFGTTRVFNSYTRQVPTFELGCEDYGLVYRLAANNQGPRLRFTGEAKNLGEVPVHNVIGTIPGTQLPNEYVLLSAHLDALDGGSGATDNATGSVLMMEAMRILKQVYPNPKRTIIIGLWDSEEQGLNGSHAFVEDNPTIIQGLQAAFNQDNGTGRIVNLSASGFVDAGASLARWLAKAPSEVTQGINLNVLGSPSGGGSDHASFICAGAPGFSLGALSWGYSDHTWHTQRDTYDKLVFDDLRNNAVLVASLVYLASEDPERVGRTKRTVFPVNPQTGQQGSWPECTKATRKSQDSSRM
ncbi:MAG TPA: M20/M25/M40 family metallo-hydrolase [Longimicrobiales bacterium]|nr:M20/M25/M40 family metallo-hydrolase [Longimicrobiales bacterium]